MFKSTKEDINQSKESSKISVMSYVISIAGVIAVCVAVICMIGLSHSNNIEMHNSEIAMYKATIVNLVEVNGSLNLELDALKQTIVDRAPDEILIDDIARYIHSNFPIVPDILYNEIAVQISILSRQESISPELIVGVVQVESSFNPMAISSKNARGLMQVMPMWAKHFNLNKVCDLHNINVGISTGIKVLKVHIEEEGGNISEGLFKYVNKDRSYVERVYNAMGKFVMFRGLIADKGGVDDSDSSTAKADPGPA